MKIPLAEMAEPTHKKQVVLRPIVPTGALETDMYRIYLDSVRVWTALARALVAGYERAATLMTDADPRQLQWLVDQASAQADSVVFAQTEKLGRWVRRVGTWHGQRTISNVQSALGVDIEPYIRLVDVENLLTDSVRANVALIRDVNARTRSAVQEIIYDAMVNRRTKKYVTDALAKAMGITKRRARLIANDQLHKLNIALTGYRNRQLGIDNYRWKHTPQEHPRHTHVRRNGKVFAWAKPPADGHPGYAINCFPGSTEVDASNGCNKLWRRHYEGHLSSISTVSGGFLKATPNHPVLTHRGWVAIDEVQQGDYLVKRINPGIVSHDDKNHLVTSFDDLFGAMNASAGLVSALGSELDFHGDGSEGRVDQINVDGLLWGDFVAKRTQTVDDFDFAGAVHYFSMPILDFLSSLKTHVAKVLRWQPAYGFMGSGSQLGSFRRRHPSMPDKAGVGSASYFRAARSKAAGNLGPLQIKTSGNRKNAFPGNVRSLYRIVRKLGFIGRWPARYFDVRLADADSMAEAVRVAGKQRCDRFQVGAAFYEFDRVIDKPIREFFSGHVFNLSNDAQWYLADGYVAHNCKCVAEPVVELG